MNMKLATAITKRGFTFLTREYIHSFIHTYIKAAPRRYPFYLNTHVIYVYLDRYGRLASPLS